MSRTTKIALGLSVASGALLAAWLLTGERKQKTKAFISKSAGKLKNAQKPAKPFDDSEAYYI